MSDDNEKKLAPDVPSDTLHAHVENHISLPDHSKFENESLMNEVSSHPNLASHSIEKLYNHMMEGSSPELTQQGHAEPYSHDWAENLLKHPNAPLHVKQDFVSKTYHPDNSASSLHEELADSGIMNEDQLRNMADAALAQGVKPYAYKNLPAPYYLNALKNTASNSDDDSQDHAREFAIEGLINSSRHTPESLSATIDEITSGRHKSPLYLARQLTDREDLSKDHLNKLHEFAASRRKDYHRDEAITEVLKHKNADPILLAKYASSRDQNSSLKHEALKHPNLPRESMNAAIKRIKSPDDYWTRQQVDALLENPSISKDQVKALISKGSTGAVQHHLADEQDVRNWWNASDKKRNAAAVVLNAANTPPDVLKELVNHKDQDVAVEALGHDKADIDVVQAGLSRKAKKVQDQARLHPLVASQQVKEGLMSGSTAFHKVYTDEDFKQHFDSMPQAEREEAYKVAHSKYDGHDIESITKKTKERPEAALYAKMKLASDDRVPEAIRTKNSADLAQMFDKHVGKNREIELGSKGISPMADSHGDFSSRVVAAVTRLADKGDRTAQKAILKNPAILNGIHGKVDLNSASPEFLNDIFEQRQKLVKSGATVYDRYGHPVNFDRNNGVLKSLYDSPALPPDIFDQIVTDKNLLESVGSSENLNRYSDLPEDKQEAKFSAVLDTGSPVAAKSTIEARAPRNAWDRAVSMLGDEASTVLADNIEHVKDHRPDTFRAAALGTFDGPDVRKPLGRDGFTRTAQGMALSKLDHQSLEDRKTLKDAIAMGTTGSIRDGHVSDFDMMAAAPKILLADPEMIDHAVAIGRQPLALKMLRHRADSSLSLGHDASAESIASTLAEINDKLKTIPAGEVDSGSDNVLASNWSGFIRGHVGRASHDFLESAKAKGVSLDFLADMPGTQGTILKRVALTNGLLSDQKVQEIAAKGDLADVLSIPSGIVKQKAVESLLKSPNLNPDTVRQLVNSMGHELMNPEAYDRGRRKSMSSEAYETFQGRMNSLLDAVQTHMPDHLSDAIAMSMRNEPGNKSADSLTNDDKDRIRDGVLKHLSSKPYANPHDRNMAMYQASRGFARIHPLSEKAVRQIEKQAFEDSDYDTILKMSDDGTLSDSGLASLSKIMANPGTLNSKQISSLSTKMIDYDTSGESVLGLTKAFETKLAEEKAVNPRADQTQQKLQFINSLSRSYTPAAGEDAAQKNEFVLNYLRKSALDPALAPVANTKILKAAEHTSDVDPQKALDIIQSLPDSVEAFSNAPGNITLGESTVNDPRFMEMSKSGWKLHALANNAEYLTGANASELVTRVLSEEGAGVSKVTTFRKLEENEFTSKEDSVRLGRSMSDNDFNFYLSKSDNTMSGNAISVAKGRLQDMEKHVKDPSAAAPGAPHMGDEHIGFILSGLKGLSNAVGKAALTESTLNAKEKMSDMSDMVQDIHRHTSEVLKHLESKATSGELNDADRGHLLEIGNIAKTLSDAEVDIDRGDAVKIFDLISRQNRLFPADQPADDPTSYNATKNIVKKAVGLEDQDWNMVFASAPQAVFGLSERSAIPSEALASIPYHALDLNDEESSVPSAFVKESTKWFGKMSDADISTHGKKLLSEYVRLAGKDHISSRVLNEGIEEGIKYVGKHMTDEDVQRMLARIDDSDAKEDILGTMVASGAGGERTYKRYAPKTIEEDTENKGRLQFALKSPHLDDQTSSVAIEAFKNSPNDDEDRHSVRVMLSNPVTSTASINKLYSLVKDNMDSGFKSFSQYDTVELMKEMMSHRNVPEDKIMSMFEITNEEYPRYMAPEGQFNPALKNPTYGGMLFRSIPIHVPEEVPHASTGKMSKNVSLQSKDYKRMNEVMALIPPEGMAWAEFKRKYPQQEKTLPASIKAVFMAANNQPVLPEAFAQAAKSLDDKSKKYHLTYSMWKSELQRHRDSDQKPNLVVQVNNSEESEKELSADPKLWALYQKLLTVSNGIGDDQIGMHPTTPHLVSWSRVDTDQEGKAWVIEEYQSNFAQKFRRNMDALIREFPAGAQINGHVVTPDEMKKYAKIIDKHLDDWSEASMQAVIDNAKANGVPKLYMHGAELRGWMSGIGDSREYWDNPNTRSRTVGFRRIYDENPRKFGFQECDYTDYPVHSSKTLTSLQKGKLSTKCWVMDLQDEGPKKRRRKA